MKKNDFGWLTAMNHGTQKDGFYIDQDNQILFWPSKKGPGYILEEEEAIQLVFRKERLSGFNFLAFGIYSIFILIILEMGYANPIPTIVSDIALYCLISLVCMKAMLLDCPWFGSTAKSLFKTVGEVGSARPSPEFLKPSAKIGKTRFFITIGGLFLFIAGGLYIFIDEGIENHLLGLFIIFCLLLGVLKYSHDEYSGINKQDLKIYKGQYSDEFYHDLKPQNNDNVLTSFFINEIEGIVLMWKYLLLISLAMGLAHQYFYRW